MTNIKLEEYTLPVYWASALINDDFSGLNDEDVRELREWLTEAKPGVCVAVDDDSWFSKYNDANTGLGCDVSKFYFNPII